MATGRIGYWQQLSVCPQQEVLLDLHVGLLI